MQKTKDGAALASRLLTYYSLSLLIFLFAQPYFDPEASLLEWLLALALVAIFLPLYFRAHRYGGQELTRGLVAIIMLGVVGSFFNTGATVFYIYAAHLVGMGFKPSRAWGMAFGLCALIVVQAAIIALFIFPDAFPYVLIPFAFAFFLSDFVAGISIQEAEKARANAKLRLAQDEVERLAAVAERERIARDLHDLLGHTLSMITLKSELASKLAEPTSPRAAQEMREVEKISREALSEVRTAVRGYRTRGLAAELASARLALETAGIGFDLYREPLELTSGQESVLALALREAVTNVVRHSGASRCSVRLHEEKDQVVLGVNDDGKGGVAKEGAGLAGMRERAASQGGSVHLLSNGGTKLKVVLPTAPSTKSRASAGRAETGTR